MPITLPRVVTCDCNAETSSAVPQIIIAARSLARVRGTLHAGMLGYYPLGPFAGEDLSGLENHATPLLTDITTTSGILCEQAEVFDGRQAYSLPFALDDVITVSGWHRPRYSRFETTLLSVGDNLRFGLSWSLEPIIVINQNADTEAIISAAAITADQWHHLAFVRDGHEYRIYVDGLPVDLFFEGNAVKIARADVAVAPGLAIISSYRGGGGLFGPTQDIIVRAAALEAHEIAAEYQSYCTAFFEIAP